MRAGKKAHTLIYTLHGKDCATPEVKHMSDELPNKIGANYQAREIWYQYTFYIPKGKITPACAIKDYLVENPLICL